MPAPVTWIGLAASVFCLAVGLLLSTRRQGDPRLAGLLTAIGLLGLGVNGRMLVDHGPWRSVFLALQGLGVILLFVLLWKHYRRNPNTTGPSADSQP